MMTVKHDGDIHSTVRDEDIDSFVVYFHPYSAPLNIQHTTPPCCFIVTINHHAKTLPPRVPESLNQQDDYSMSSMLPNAPTTFATLARLMNVSMGRSSSAAYSRRSFLAYSLSFPCFLYFLKPSISCLAILQMDCMTLGVTYRPPRLFFRELLPALRLRLPLDTERYRMHIQTNMA